VSGRVQGVFFRAATRATASEIGLTGWVRNTPDGAVELLACGSEQGLVQLEKWLRQGPPHAQVGEVSMKPVESRSHNGFEIRY
jgi:acylphosphatase